MGNIMKKKIINILIATIFINTYFLNGDIVKASSIELGIDEDVNEDGEVNILDLSLVGKAYNLINNDDGYNLRYDINKDNIVDLYDIVRASKKLGTITLKIGYVYNSSYVNIRSGPGTNYSKIGELYLDDKVEIVNDSNKEWYKIKFESGHAFVHKSYITETVPSSDYRNSLDYYVDIQSKRLNLTDKTGQWIDATKDEIKYYMNPSNFIDNIGKYMFMKLTYTSGITLDIANEVIKEKGILDGRGQAFLLGGEKYNVNPIYLMCHARLETGNGTSKLSTGVLVDTVDGKSVTPRVVYNMFGIGADDNDTVRLGAEMAYKQGWFTPELAIIEGAYWIGNMYINNIQYKQDTLYKMRWNLTSLGVGYHQYATDIGWAYKQAKMMATYLNKCDGVKFEFDIPTFIPTLREIYNNNFKF